MAHKALVQQFTKHVLRAAAEVGTEAVGEQKRRTAWHISSEGTGWRWRLAETDGGKLTMLILCAAVLLAPVVVG